MAKIFKIIYAVSDYSGRVVSYLVWIGALMLAWEVVSRYVFGHPTIWAHGYSQRIFGCYFIMIGAFTLIKGGHVRIDLITNQFSFRTKKAFDLLNYAFLLIWGYVLVTEGWRFFMNSWKINEVDEMALAHPVYPIKFILVVGSLIITLQALSFFIQTIISFYRGEEYVP